MVTREEILRGLREVYDPEVPVNVVDLGFIREVKVEGNKVEIKMTLTNPFCPMHRTITKDVEDKVSGIEGVDSVRVELVFDPPWSPDDISDEAKKKLGVND